MQLVDLLRGGFSAAAPTLRGETFVAAGIHAGIHAVGTAGSLHVNVMWTCIYTYIM